MKRPTILLPAVAALIAAGLLAGIALGRAGAPAAVTVRTLFNATLKQSVLVTGSGLTLYRNRLETGGKIRCTAGCRAAWPPLLVAARAKPLAGAGAVQRLLGTLKRPDGGVQVTYRGAPLYRFAADRSAGQAAGQGLAGIWFAVPAGSAQPPATTAPPATTTGYPTDTTPTIPY